MASNRNGSLCAVWSIPVSTGPALRSRTAARGVAARAICSAACADRFDHPTQAKVGGRECFIIFTGKPLFRTTVHYVTDLMRNDPIPVADLAQA
jgi:hypothetical protein